MAALLHCWKISAVLKSTPKSPFFGKLIEPLHQIADFENGHSDR
jgi:hypothetical protein